MLTRLGYLRDEITAGRALELFEAARVREGADLVGDLAGGFEFFARTGEQGEQLVRCRVERLTPAAAAASL